MKIQIYVMTLLSLGIINVKAQKKIVYQLSKLEDKDLQLVQRSKTVTTENGKSFIRLSENKGEGLVWLPISDFENGSLSITMRGKDELQRSFIGLAFHALNDSTYDAVYCRPFNFFAKDSVRRIHAIQYVSHPIYTWKKLREEQNAQFEKAIVNPPNPNDWFTLKLEIKNDVIKAYINDQSEPALVVNKISLQVSGKIGLFMGDSSGGDFGEIVIRKK